MKAPLRRGLPLACLAAALSIAHGLLAAWLVDRDALALLLRGHAPGVALAVLVLLAVRLTLLFVVPGWLLYWFFTSLEAAFARRESWTSWWHKRRFFG